MTIAVELSPEMEERFHAEARVRGLTLGAYVQQLLVQSAQGSPPAKSLSSDDLNRILDEAADLIPGTPALSDFAMSRESIYTHEDEW